MKFILSCCSPADLTSEHLSSRNIPYVPFHLILGNKEMIDDLGKSISYEEFYQAMVDGADTKTMQVNIDEYTAYFKELLKQGLPILHVTLSGGLSGTSNSAMIASREINEELGKKMVYVCDSLGASGGYGLLVDKLCDLRDEEKTVEEVYAWAEENKLKVHHWFFSTDLTFFIRGGRVSKVSGWFGTLLKICPLLNVDNNGKLIPRQKIRGKKAVVKAIVDKMIEFADGGLNYNQKVYITHSNCLDDALAVKTLVEENFPNVECLLVNSIGTTIGCHTGPGTVALFFWGEERKD